MAYDYQDDYAQQQAEQMRLMQEEQERQRLEAERAAQEQAQQQAPVDRTLGGMLAPQGGQPQTYQPGAYGQPPQTDPRALAGMMQGQAPGAPPNVADYGQQRGTQGPQAGQAQGAPTEAPAPEAPAAAPPVNPYITDAKDYYGGTAFPTGTVTPDRKTSEMDLDQFNQSVRNSELYQQFTRQRGIGSENAWGTGKWSEADREAWKATLAAQGVQLPKGMKVDDGGNLNQVNTKNKKILIGAALVGGTIATAGALGAFGGAAAAGGAAAGATGAAAGTAGAVGAGTAAAATGAAAAGAAGAGMGIMPSVITGLAGLGSTYMGARAQSQAGKQAANATREANAASERTLTAQMEFERQQRAEERADAERRWNAEQEMARRMWDAQEEERLYQRKIFEEDRAAAANRGSGGGYSGPSGPDPRELRRQQARNTLASLLAQGTPNLGGPAGYTPATSAGPLGRG